MLLALIAVMGTGLAWQSYRHVVSGVTTSSALADTPKSVGKDQNILIMGLDSRLDQQGKPLPQHIYNALHAGDESVGGYNSNVLILLHLPGNGSKATAISIPRDDYVTMDKSACGGGTCKAKIKEAYGHAFEYEKQKLSNRGIKDEIELEQKSREAGRKAQIKTVQAFLGGIPIDHFVEVTLISFFQIAEVVQPITVCLNQKTYDSFSGARFVKGPQQINAKQAMAFVRQRRDPDESLNFTDLDRTRRQQAFMVSLVSRLQQGGMTSPTQLRGLLDVAKQNIAVDSGLDLMAFAKDATKLMAGGIAMYTLPVVDFGKDPNGAEINIVDVPAIRAMVKNLLSPPPPAGAPSTSAAQTSTAPPPIAAASGVQIDVANGTGTSGLANHVVEKLAARGFTGGNKQTVSVRSTTTVSYGKGAEPAATALASELGLTATASTATSKNTVRLTVGTDSNNSPLLAGFTPPADGDSSTSTTTPAPPKPIDATATGGKAPTPTDLSRLDSAGVPCVK